MRERERLPGPWLGRRRREDTVETVVSPVGSRGRAGFWLRLCQSDGVKENVLV